MAGGRDTGYKVPKEVLVYEERPDTLYKLCKLIEKTESDLKIHRTSRIEEAYHLVFERNLTMVVIMPFWDRECNSAGLDLLHTIKRIEDRAFVPIILVAKEELNLSHFFGELHCFGILDAEYEEGYAKRLIKEALRFPTRSSRKEFAYFKEAGIIHNVRISDILYTEHHSNLTIVHTNHGTLKIGARSRQDILSKFEAYDFLACARGIVANMMSVEKIDLKNHLLYFAGRDEPVEYGKSYKESIQSYLSMKEMI